jgi:formate dehydrogenase subunit gamma
MQVDAAGRFLVRCVIALLFILAPGFAAAQQGTSNSQQQGPGVQEPDAARIQEKGQPAEAQRQVAQPLNNAPLWRDIRSGDINAYQTTQVRGIETNVLIQSEGEIWRRIRNGPITVFGGWLIVAVFLLIGLFYWWRGEIMLHAPRTGREILRFTPWERFVHWTTAIAFLILAVSGIFMLFGRYVILPVFGYTIFSTLTILGKNLHNFVGPLFVVCTLLMVVTFLRRNLWRAYDWTWMRRFGDFIRGEHVPSGKFNAGEKVWFWFGVLALGTVVSVTGLVLDFPNFDQGRQTMQTANVIHAIAAVTFMAMSLGHIYLGTIGLEGSYDAMRHGTVDETWAKEHHEYWYNEVVGERELRASGVSPKTAPASSMKEGWVK